MRKLLRDGYSGKYGEVYVAVFETADGGLREVRLPHDNRKTWSDQREAATMVLEAA